jgi:hypothetical protein
MFHQSNPGATVSNLNNKTKKTGPLQFIYCNILLDATFLSNITLGY